MLEERVALVTGGSRGIGAAAAKALACDGYHVVTASRGPATSPHLHVIADVANEDDVERLFAKALAALGRLDVVVHCAGLSRGALLVSLTDAALDDVLSANLTGSFLVARAAARYASVVVLLGSLAQHGSPANASYALTKGGMLGLSRVLNRQSGLRAHLLSVGYVETELTYDLPERTRKLLIDTCPLKRSATPDEVGELIVAIANDSTAFDTDNPIYVSGGLVDFPT